jgi:hypothetical protein
MPNIAETVKKQTDRILRQKALNGTDRIEVSGVATGTGAPAPTINSPAADLTAHKSSTDHDGRYYTESEIDNKLNFLTLTDTPAAYTGEGGKIVAVKSDVTGLEFIAAPAAANGVPAGGTTNQLAAKNSNTDYDLKWMDAPAAANGIPTGGTAGQILEKIDGTNFNAQWAAKTPLTTKGDLLVYGSALARLGVGTDGQVLTADAASTPGVKWATPSSGGNADVTRIALSSNLDVGSNTWTTVTWASEVFDDAEAWVSSAPTVITVPAGYTRIRLTTYIAFVNSTGIRNCTINKTDVTNPLVVNAQAAQNETGLLADTGWLGCAEGDSFYVQVYSGGGADLLGSATWGGPCWFQAEFI